MAKTKISEFSSTAASNTDIDSINIAEGCSPSGINDAIRELMSQLKDWQSGTSNDPYVVGSSGSLTLNQGTANGVAYLNGSKVVTSGSALTFDGTGLSVTGTSSATLKLNGRSSDNGSSANFYDNTGTTRYGFLYFDATTAQIASANTTPLAFLLNGSEQMRLTSTGLGIGTSSPSTKLTIGNGGGGNNLGMLLSRGATTNFLEVYDGTKSFIAGTDSSQSFAKVGTLSTHPVRLVADNGGAYAHLDTSGNLGLGVTPSAWSGISSVLQMVNGSVVAFSGSTATIAANGYYNAGYKYISSSYASRYTQDQGSHQWFTAPSGTAGNAITFTQALTLDASGNLLVGTTTASGGISGAAPRLVVIPPNSSSHGMVLKSEGSTYDAGLIWNAGTSGNNHFFEFGTEGTYTARGSITYNRAGGLTVYNTTSDYRAKDIYGAISDSGSVIDSVPVYMGKMKGATQERPMFIAHETPVYAHTGEKDAVDADGNPIFQQMDASALIPVMWAEIQSLRKRLADAGIA